MKLGKYTERAAKSLLLAPQTLFRYGTLSPKRARLHGCENWIHIDPKDRRAIKKFVHDPIRKRVSPPLSIWREFLKKLTPAIAIDVGVNYGECLFGARYGEKTKVYGFEANPRIVQYLHKSRLDHPDADRITIVEGLVADNNADEIPFYHNPGWSGTGSAVRSLNDDRGLVSHSVTSRTIDSVIPCHEADGATLLFKMDIEGYEPRAFEGFWQTVDAARLVVGFVEFDTTYLREAGTDPARYFERLGGRFDIHRFTSCRKNTLVGIGGLDELPTSRAPDGRVHTDLLLSSCGANPADWLPGNWSIDSRPRAGTVFNSDREKSG